MINTIFRLAMATSFGFFITITLTLELLKNPEKLATYCWMIMFAIACVGFLYHIGMAIKENVKK